jgi:hypothetical protein
MEAYEALEKGAEYIAEHGHTKNQFTDEGTGAACVMGAVIEVMHWGNMWDNEYWKDGSPSWKSHIEFEAWRSEVEPLFKQRFNTDGIPEWNDAPETSVEDVILGMKHVAAELREKEGK